MNDKKMLGQSLNKAIGPMAYFPSVNISVNVSNNSIKNNDTSYIPESKSKPHINYQRKHKDIHNPSRSSEKKQWEDSSATRIKYSPISKEDYHNISMFEKTAPNSILQDSSMQVLTKNIKKSANQRSSKEPKNFLASYKTITRKTESRRVLNDRSKSQKVENLQSVIQQLKERVRTLENENTTMRRMCCGDVYI